MISEDDSIEMIEDDDYWYFSKSSLFLLLFVIFSIFFIVAYNIIDEFREIIDINYIHIMDNFDLAFIFYTIIVIPYFITWFICVLKLIKTFWTSYEFVKLKIFIRKFRINFSLFGFTASLICIISNQRFLSYLPIIISIIVVIVVNFFFISYTEMEEEERRLAKENPESRKIQTEITYFQLISIIALGFFIIFYFGNDTLNSFINTLYEFIKSDILLLIVLWMSFLLSILWFAVSFLIDAGYYLYQNIKERLYNILTLIYFFFLIYLLAKLIIFNLSSYLEEPYPSVISMGTSLGGLLFQKNYSKIIDWYKKKRGLDVDV